MVMKRGYDPFIVFSFSKKECESLALSLSGLDLNTLDEKQLVEGVFKNAIDVLTEEDQRLPQIGALLPMLKRGIGVHHSGLLPILKELVELLFQVGPAVAVMFDTAVSSCMLMMKALPVQSALPGMLLCRPQCGFATPCCVCRSSFISHPFCNFCHGCTYHVHGGLLT